MHKSVPFTEKQPLNPETSIKDKKANLHVRNILSGKRVNQLQMFHCSQTFSTGMRWKTNIIIVPFTFLIVNGKQPRPSIFWCTSFLVGLSVYYSVSLACMHLKFNCNGWAATLVISNFPSNIVVNRPQGGNRWKKLSLDYWFPEYWWSFYYFLLTFLLIVYCNNNSENWCL